MQLKGEIHLGRKVSGLRKIVKDQKSNSILFVTQHGGVGVLIETNKKTEIIAEQTTALISKRLPWQAGLSPIHGIYYPKVHHNYSWRKLPNKPKKNISYYPDVMLFLEMPMIVQQKLVQELGLSLRDFRKFTNYL